MEFLQKLLNIENKKMNLLLCSPVSKDAKQAGGISVWANNILEYLYFDKQENIQYKVVACDRTSRINENTGIIKRLWCGIQDYLSIVKDIKQHLKNEHIDVVHVNSTASISSIKDILIACVAHRYGAKVAVHYHFGRIPKLIKQNNWEWKLVEKAIKMADMAIVMDNCSYEALQDLGFKNIVNIPNPYSTALEKQVNAIEGTVERVKHRILYIGRAFRLKGIYELTEACTRIDNIELRVVGPYDEADKQNLLALCNNAPWFHLIGPIPHDKVLEELMACEVFVLPSYSEGFPNAILESMMCKTPIITTPVGAISQMLELDTDNPCGISVGVKSVDDIAVAIARVIDNDDLKKDMTERAYHKVRTEFNLQTVGAKLCATWKDMLK